MLKKMSKLVITLVLLTGLLMTGVVQAGELDPDNFDLGGQNVTFVRTGGKELFDEEKGSPVWLERKLMTEDAFNCKLDIKVYSWRSYAEDVTASMMAGDANWDIIRPYTLHFWPLAGQGYLYPVNNVLPEDYYDQFKMPKDSLANLYGLKEEIYGINDFVKDDAMVVFWNKDLFAKEGLPSLYDIYNSGEWTWDKMTEIAKQLTKDTDGDGETDQWGMITAAAILGTGHFTNNADPYITDENGNYHYNLDSPAYTEFLHWLRELTVELKVNNYIGGASRAGSMFREGNVGMFPERMGQAGSCEAHMADDYGIVPLPMGPNADKHYYPSQGNYIDCMPITVENPKALAAIYKYFFLDMYSEEEKEEQIVNKWQNRFRDKESFDIAMKIINSGEQAKFIRFMGLHQNTARREIIHPILLEGNSVSTAVEESKPVIQNLINELLDQ